MSKAQVTGVTPGHTDYDYLVFIGRFQPFHLGHQRVIDQALTQAKNVIVLIGSSNQPRSYRNPFTFEERRDMLRQSYLNSEAATIVEPIYDYPYNEQAWIAHVQKTVNDLILINLSGNSERNTLHGMKDLKIGLIGCNKDSTSYYLKLFPTWGSESVTFLDPINATYIREEYFISGSINTMFKSVSEHVSKSVRSILTDFSFSPEFYDLVNDYSFVAEYKNQWKDSPYPPIFTTVDAVVIQSGHVLLVTRGARPGKGQLALPGGFLNHSERLLDGMLRELREETGLKVPAPVLQGNILRPTVFDDPNRSSRGRTITYVYLIELPEKRNLPKVRGGDDAAKAHWVPLGELDPMNMFEDHFHIIQHMIGKGVPQ